MSFAIFVLAVVFFALVILDITSTQSFLEMGTGVEANPAMRWLQGAFPQAWPDIKAGASLLLAGVIVALLPAAFALGALAGLDFFYLVVWLKNRNLNK